MTTNTTTGVETEEPPDRDGRPGASVVEAERVDEDGLDADGAEGDAAATGAQAGGEAGGEIEVRDLRSLRRAWTAGAIVVAALFTWLVMVGRWDPLQRQFFDDFFDVQARSMLDGRWDVPRETVGFEGFLIDGKVYIYFGAFPSVLRMPLFLVTDRFDGQLTTISMILAMVVLAIGGHRLNVAIRTLVRGADPVTRAERVATFLLALAVLGGVPLWLGSVAAVFHEAILWGLALTVAALSSLIRWMRRPTPWGLAASTALTAGAVASRQPLGLGLLSGLALVAFVIVVTRLVAWRTGRPPRLATGVPLAGVVLIGVVGFLACAVPNMVKFGNPISPAIDDHIASMTLPDRMEFLEASDGSYFGVDYAPTTLLQYARPDALAFRSDFPWVDFAPAGPTVIGDVTFDSLEWSSSVPVTMTALLVLAVPGIVWLVRSLGRRDGSDILLFLWIGAGAAPVGAVTIAYIGHRYLGDIAPVVIVPGLVGAHLFLRWSPQRAGLRRAAAGGLAVLVVFGLWVNFGLGVTYQRTRGFNIPDQWRAELAAWRADLPGTRRSVVEVGENARRLPREPDGTLAVVGDCLGLYERVGDTWYGVTRGPGAGVHDIRVDIDALDDLDTGERAPLATVGEGDDAVVLAVSRLSDGTVRTSTRRVDSARWSPGWEPADLDGEVTVRVINDPRAPEPFVRAGRDHLGPQITADPTETVVVGRVADGVDVPGVLDRYPGDVEAVEYDPDLCRRSTGVG